MGQIVLKLYANENAGLGWAMLIFMRFLVLFLFLSPSVHTAWSTHMHRFLSVRLPVIITGW